MIEISPKPKKLPKYPLNIKKMTEIPPKPKKWLKYPWNLKNDQNNPKTFKGKKTKIPPKPKENDWNTPET